MLKQLLRKSTNIAPDLLASKLLNETTFYPALLKDLNNCQSEVIIESPFITSRRIAQLVPILEKLKLHKVRIIINTRDPHEYDEDFRRDEAHRVIACLQHLGVHVLLTGHHHRKLAIIDRRILYEGSLNILSQNNSREIMRRIESVQLAWQMIGFVEIDKYF